MPIADFMPMAECEAEAERLEAELERLDAETKRVQADLRLMHEILARRSEAAEQAAPLTVKAAVLSALREQAGETLELRDIYRLLPGRRPGSIAVSLSELVRKGSVQRVGKALYRAA